jgi:hypothetical protein
MQPQIEGVDSRNYEAYLGHVVSETYVVNYQGQALLSLLITRTVIPPSFSANICIGVPITVRRVVDVRIDAHVSSTNVVPHHLPSNPDQSLFALVDVLQTTPASEAVLMPLRFQLGESRIVRARDIPCVTSLATSAS